MSRILQASELRAQQGRHLCRPGEAYVKVLGSFEQIQGVEVSGYAVTVLTGHLIVPK